MAAVTSAMKKGGSTAGLNGQNYIGLQHAQFKIEDFLTNGGATTDYFTAITIPADTVLKIWGVRNTTALSMGSGPAVSVGDSSSATLFVNASSVVTVDSLHTRATNEKQYDTADTLRVTLTGGTLATGTFEIVYSLINVNPRAPMTT